MNWSNSLKNIPNYRCFDYFFFFLSCCDFVLYKFPLRINIFSTSKSFLKLKKNLIQNSRHFHEAKKLKKSAFFYSTAKQLFLSYESVFFDVKMKQNWLFKFRMNGQLKKHKIFIFFCNKNWMKRLNSDIESLNTQLNDYLTSFFTNEHFKTFKFSCPFWAISLEVICWLKHFLEYPKKPQVWKDLI